MRLVFQYNEGGVPIIQENSTPFGFIITRIAATQIRITAFQGTATQEQPNFFPNINNPNLILTNIVMRDLGVGFKYASCTDGATVNVLDIVALDLALNLVAFPATVNTFIFEYKSI